MKVVLLKDLKQGDYFTLKDYGEYPSENVVWVRDFYSREAKKYCIHKFNDVNHDSFKKGNTKVYTDFIF